MRDISKQLPTVLPHAVIVRILYAKFPLLHFLSIKLDNRLFFNMQNNSNKVV